MNSQSSHRVQEYEIDVLHPHSRKSYLFKDSTMTTHTALFNNGGNLNLKSMDRWEWVYTCSAEHFSLSPRMDELRAHRSLPGSDQLRGIKD